MKCPICKSTTIKVRYTGVPGFGIERQFDIVDCGACGVAFTAPFLSPVEQRRYYNSFEVAFNGEGGNVLLDNYAADKAELWSKLRYQNRLTEIKKLHPGAKKVLDIGCGAGIWLDFLREHGFEPYGLELSRWGYQSAQKLGLTVYNQPLVQLASATLPKFDVVTMYDVLEHTNNPAADLHKLRDILAPNGLVVINAPNFASFIAKVTGPSWNKLIPPNHTFHFTPSVLRTLLHDTGFQLVSQSTNHGSPSEFMAELAAASWRLPGRALPALRRAYALKDKPLEEHKSAAVAAVKATQKSFGKLGFVAQGLYPILSALNLGEGLHFVAAKA